MAVPHNTAISIKLFNYMKTTALIVISKPPLSLNGMESYLHDDVFFLLLLCGTAVVRQIYLVLIMA